MEELQIQAPDDEEVEISFGKDNYKIKRKFRRTYRELKYYALENKFFFALICLLFVISFSFVIYLNFEVYNKKYNESEVFTIDGVNYKVISSYASNVNYKGNIITEGKEYIIILLNIENNSDERKTLKTEDLKLISKNQQYSVSFSKNNHFIDFGEGYYNQILYPGEEKSYLLIYEIPESSIDKSYIFRMISDVNYLRGEIQSNHRDVIITPTYYQKGDVIKSVNLGGVVDLGSTTLTDTNAIVLSYETNSSYTVSYNYCVLNNCYVGEKVIAPDIVGKIPKTIMKLEIDFQSNENLFISKYLKDNEDLISMFGKLVYVVDGVKKSCELETFDYEYLTGRDVYAEVPAEILNASSIILNITVRNFVFNITLK